MFGGFFIWRKGGAEGIPMEESKNLPVSIRAIKIICVIRVIRGPDIFTNLTKLKLDFGMGRSYIRGGINKKIFNK